MNCPGRSFRISCIPSALLGQQQISANSLLLPRSYQIKLEGSLCYLTLSLPVKILYLRFVHSRENFLRGRIMADSTTYREGFRGSTLSQIWLRHCRALKYSGLLAFLCQFSTTAFWATAGPPAPPL